MSKPAAVRFNLFAPAAPAPLVKCPLCRCCEQMPEGCAGKCDTAPAFHTGGGWADLDAALARAEYAETAGYDPERENGQPRRSSEWNRALGWTDSLHEEALEWREARAAEAQR